LELKGLSPTWVQATRRAGRDHRPWPCAAAAGRMTTGARERPGPAGM
jgi:hypothetical protein